MFCSYCNFLPGDTQTSREQIPALGDILHSQAIWQLWKTTKEKSETGSSNASQISICLESPWHLVKMQIQIGKTWVSTFLTSPQVILGAAGPCPILRVARRPQAWTSRFISLDFVFYMWKNLISKNKQFSNAPCSSNTLNHCEFILVYFVLFSVPKLIFSFKIYLNHSWLDSFIAEEEDEIAF